jgi:hypothetical protein
MEQYFLPLFNSETSVAMVVCGPSQRDEIVTGLEAEGFEVEFTEMDDKVPWADEGSTLDAIKEIFSGGQDLFGKMKGMFKI